MPRWNAVAGRRGNASDERREPSPARPSARRTAVRAAVILAVCLATVTAGVTVAAETAGPAKVTHSEPAVGDPATDRGTDCGVPTGSATSSTTATHRIVELYPDPTTDGNVGEYLVVESPGNATPALTVSDGHSTATIPADRPPGRVAVSLDPNATESLTEYPVVELEGHLRLAAGGEELTLANASDELETVVYDDAPEGEIWYRTPDARAVAGDAADIRNSTTAGPSVHRGEWWPQDGTCRPVTSFDVDAATAFVLPDSPSAVDSFLASADDRIRLAGYTLTDADVREDLLAALDRGVAVEILVDRSPVGGMPAATDGILTELADAGAAVRVVGGEAARYAFHHPKYAVVDDRVLVTTENWKPAGVGGAASRGWGVVVSDADLAESLGDLFDADATGHDTATWAAARPRIDFAEAEPAADGSFPERHEPTPVDVDEVELLLAPDNAGDRLEALIGEADDSVRIVQVQVGDPNFRLLEAALAAARDGVDVDLLLDASWYVAEDNRDLADRLESAAERDDIPLEVRLADGGERFERIHAKGMVIDEEIAVVGSLNWNDNSVTANREVVLVLHGSEAAGYFASVFDADWAESSGPSVPVTMGLAVVAGLAAAVLAGRRYLRFSPAGDPEPTPTTEPVTIDPAETDDPRPPPDEGRRDDRGT